MTADEALRKYTLLLRQYGIEEAEEDARALLCHVLNCDLPRLFAQPGRVLSDNETRKMEELVGRRIKRVPTAYLMNTRQFFGMDLYVDERVLIPRPETEVLVEEAIKCGLEFCSAYRRAIKIADVGTGSGAIAIALAANIPGSIIHAIDISEDALNVAKINVDKYGLADRVVLIKADLLWKNTEKYDMVVANLPYISESELPFLPDEITRYEPRLALSGGELGMETILELIGLLSTALTDKGIVLLEIGVGQENVIMDRIKADLPYAQVELVRDLAGINRILKIEISSFDNDRGLL